MQPAKCFEILVGSHGRGGNRRDRLETWVATLCRLGLGLGDPWVTQGSRKGLPTVTQGPPKGRFDEVPLFATKDEKRPGGVENRSPESPTSRVIAGIGKAKPLTTNDTKDQNLERNF